MSNKRKRNDCYVQFGFTFTETTEGLQKPQCMFCNIVFSNASLNPSKLQEHFNNRHGEADVSGHDVNLLKAKGSALNHKEHFQSWVLYLLTNHYKWLHTMRSIT